MAERTVGSKHLILYDGECGLCSRAMAFTSTNCSSAEVLFIPLESDAAKALLGDRAFEGGESDTMFVFPKDSRPGCAPLAKSEAAFFVARHLDWPWKALSAFGWLPTSLLDWAYDHVARNRRMMLGPTSSCPVPARSSGRPHWECNEKSKPRHPRPG